MANMHLNSKTKEMCFINAKKHRARCTAAESILWEQLRDRRFQNLKFRRQHPLSNYIADFFCYELQLVIEVDGGYHQKQDQKEEDEKRTKFLMGKGIKVFRLTNEEVLNIDFALNKLKTFIDSLKVPSLEGEG